MEDDEPDLPLMRHPQVLEAIKEFEKLTDMPAYLGMAEIVARAKFADADTVEAAIWYDCRDSFAMEDIPASKGAKTLLEKSRKLDTNPALFNSDVRLQQLTLCAMVHDFEGIQELISDSDQWSSIKKEIDAHSQDFTRFSPHAQDKSLVDLVKQKLEFLEDAMKEIIPFIGKIQNKNPSSLPN